MKILLSVVLALTASFAEVNTVKAATEPTCQKIAPQQTTLQHVSTTFVNVSLAPFGLAYEEHKKIAFASTQRSLNVLNTSTFPPSLLYQIPYPPADVNLEGGLGITLTHDGRHLLVSALRGAIIYDVAQASKGSLNAVVGFLNGTVGNSAIQTTVTSDGYAFVSQEYGTNATANHGAIEVFKLHKADVNKTISSTYIGYLTLGYAVVGTTLSPNESVLYATSEVIRLNSSQGSLSIIDVETLKKNPSQALLSNVTAGCSPVRTIVSSNGEVVWVTARESNHLLAYDTAKLLSAPNDALIVSLQVGQSPVGLTFVKNESRILTADSNRFRYANSTTGLSVVDVGAALRGEQAVLGRISTGSATASFPREFAVSHNGRTVLVADYASNQIEAVDVATIP